MLDVEGQGVHDVGGVAAVIHQHHLVQDLGRGPVEDTPHGPQQRGERLCNTRARDATSSVKTGVTIVEDDDHAGGGEVVEDIGEGLALA